MISVQIMTDTFKTPQIKLACHAQNRLSDLQNLSTGLEKCQKSLNDYLDAKRNAFPRFFFISDDELLSILGSSDPECVQEHMIKVKHSVCATISLLVNILSCLLSLSISVPHLHLQYLHWLKNSSSALFIIANYVISF